MADTDWITTASIWLSDPDRGRVLIGRFGFAWWQGKKLYVAQFKSLETSPLSGYKAFAEWETAKEYPADQVPMPAVVRFVRTGLLPA